MGQTQMERMDRRTDGLTDGQGGDYMLPRYFSGSIITCIPAKNKYDFDNSFATVTLVFLPTYYTYT